MHTYNTYTHIRVHLWMRICTRAHILPRGCGYADVCVEMSMCVSCAFVMHVLCIHTGTSLRRALAGTFLLLGILPRPKAKKSTASGVSLPGTGTGFLPCYLPAV